MGARTLEKCKTYYEGRVFKTNKCGDIVVINYFNTYNDCDDHGQVKVQRIDV